MQRQAKAPARSAVSQAIGIIVAKGSRYTGREGGQAPMGEGAPTSKKGSRYSRGEGGQMPMGEGAPTTDLEKSSTKPSAKALAGWGVS